MLGATIDTVPLAGESGALGEHSVMHELSAPGQAALEASLGTPEGRERAAGYVARVVEPKGGAPQIVEAGAMSRYGRAAGW